jgi:HK97 family phage major capsid protein
MVEQLRAAYDAATAELRERKEALDAAHKRVLDPDDPAELAEREADFNKAAEAFDEQAAEVERTRVNLEAAEKREKIVADNPVTDKAGQPATARGSLKRELTYRPDTPERSFFRDAYAAQFQMDGQARDRLDSHTREMHDEYRDRGIVMHEPERRDVGTGAFTGLVTPVYLEDQFVNFRRAGFPLYDWMRKLPLPGTGMTVNIGRLTTGTAAAAQASENAAVQETDADDTLLAINVRTYAGQQDVARQALERGLYVDQVIYEDLTRAYFTKLGDACYNADGTSGTHLGIRSTSGIVAVTYTDASPTVPELWPKLQDAIQQVNAGIFAPANVIVMHPRRWGWLNASLDGSSRPYLVPNTAVAANPFAVGGAAGYGVPVGSLSGLPVLTDGNIATTLGGGTEDNILVIGTSELFFWQEGDGSPRRFQFEQSAAPQSIRLAVWGYSAFTAGRYPLASANVSGSGLAAPSF